MWVVKLTGSEVTNAGAEAKDLDFIQNVTWEYFKHMRNKFSFIILAAMWTLD